MEYALEFVDLPICLLYLKLFENKNYIEIKYLTYELQNSTDIIVFS